MNYGPWFDISGTGLSSVHLFDANNSKEDLSHREWTYQVGLEGEHLGLDKISNANSYLWTRGSTLPISQTLIWYKVTFLAPKGNAPLSLNLASMGKGQAWVNGKHIGRYWSAYRSPSTGCSKNCDYRGTYDSWKCLKKCGEPAQIWYHVPRNWLRPGGNLLVLHEELGGDPTKIHLVEKNRQVICSHVAENDPPPVDSWTKDEGFTSQLPEVRLQCDQGWHISEIPFAKFGTIGGDCGEFVLGGCHSDLISALQQVCLGNEGCRIPVSIANLGDPCPGVLKSLAVQAVCIA